MRTGPLSATLAFRLMSVALLFGCSDDGTGTGSDTTSTSTVTGSGGSTSSGTGTTTSSAGSTSSGTGGNGGGGGTTTGGGPTPCGAIFCDADETCVDGACTYPCTGVNVPGDYASVAAAVDALEPVGGTICVGAGRWTQGVGAAPSADMQIIGTSSDAVLTGGISLAPVQGAHLTMSHLRVESLVFVGTYSGAGLEGDVRIEASTIAATDAGEYALRSIASFQGHELVIDRSDLSSVGGLGAIEIGVTLTGATHKVTIQNSFIHDSIEGVRLVSISNAANEITFLNNTFQDNDTALHLLAPLGANLTLRYSNNVFTGSSTAVDLTAQPSNVIEHTNNALFGNTTNYAGSAVPGTGYVLTDLMLDAGTPPGPAPGSPLIGAANPASATTEDFWSTTRGAAPDIGAVEAP